MYYPDFDCDCRLCGHRPTVIVDGHLQPDTELCGVCFFGDRTMVDWSKWVGEPEQDE